MRAGLVAAVAAVMMVAGCATVRESRVNPLNWFGSSQSTAGPVVTEAAAQARSDGRILAEQITELHVERATGGVILRAVGLPPAQGRYHAVLAQVPGEDRGDLVFEFVLKEPDEPQATGPAVSRQITAAIFVNNFRLETVRSITVRGAQNARSTRR